MPAPGLEVAVCFGGPSVEHDVSIITAQQLMAVLEERHRPVPLYLARDGRFWTGDALRDVAAFGGDAPAGGEPCELRLGAPEAPLVVPSSSRLKGDRAVRADVLLNSIHGTGGEDGALLGALDLTDLPYAGGGMSASAVAMDKHLAKTVFAGAGIDVLPSTVVAREDFSADPASVAARVAGEAGLPCYVKPISLGSSIGVTRCTSEDELLDALELCFELDRRALVEPALDDGIEINVAVLGRPGGELRASETEQPVKEGPGALSFEDKYLRGGGKGGGGAKGAGATKGSGPSKGAGAVEGGGAKGASSGMASADRIIPAPVPAELAQRVKDAALAAHRALGFAGVARYDFLIGEPDSPSPRVVLNEANTVPGSFAFYLFEPAGIPFVDLADALIDIAFAEAAERRATTRTFKSFLLSRHGGGA